MEHYRLYIDESGHNRYSSKTSMAERYLCLYGIIIRKDENENNLVPRISDIHKLFYTDYDLRPALHLEDIIRRKNKFAKLHNQKVEEDFNNKILSFPLIKPVCVDAAVLKILIKTQAVTLRRSFRPETY